MAKAQARTLKVFETQLGFYETVVAASSQAAALRAWGTHQNLFASGAARVAVDKAAIAAALKNPEKPLRRAVGSTDAFALEPTSLPKIPDAPKKLKPQPSAKAKPSPRPTADRSSLTAAEAKLHELDEKRKQEEVNSKREADALAQRLADAQASYVAARKEANTVVQLAREKYRKAGGVE